MSLKRFLSEFYARALPIEQIQAPKNQTRFTYDMGPMYFLGQQIVKNMQQQGYPSYIHTCFRPPEIQEEKHKQGLSKAPAWASPHQYYEAVDIVHLTKHWHASNQYWHALNNAVEIIAEKYGVELEHGYDWGWDSAHIELADWRKVRDRHRELDWLEGGMRPPHERDRVERFKEVLPSVWAQYQRSMTHFKQAHRHYEDDPQFRP